MLFLFLDFKFFFLNLSKQRYFHMYQDDFYLLNILYREYVYLKLKVFLEPIISQLNFNKVYLRLIKKEFFLKAFLNQLKKIK